MKFVSNVEKHFDILMEIWAGFVHALENHFMRPEQSRRAQCIVTIHVHVWYFVVLCRSLNVEFL